MVILGKVQFFENFLYFKLIKEGDRFFWVRFFRISTTLDKDKEVEVQVDLTNYYLVYVYMNPFSFEDSGKLILPYSNWYFKQKILQSRRLLPIAFCSCILITAPLLLLRLCLIIGRVLYSLNYSLTSLAYSLTNPIINRMKRSYSYVRKFLVSKV